MVVEANRWRQQHEQRNGYVQPGVLAQWLAIVISGSARRVGDDVDEAARLAALSFAVEEHPAYCFTKPTLRAAQRRFKFMPTPSELLEFCDEIVTAEKQTADRLWKIVEIGVTTGATMREQDLARSMQLNREAADRERVALAAAAGIDVPVAPPQDPGESDRDYCLRLSALAKAHCTEGGRALRHAERQLARAAARPAPAPAEAAAAAPTVGESTKPDDAPAAAPAEAEREGVGT